MKLNIFDIYNDIDVIEFNPRNTNNREYVDSALSKLGYIIFYKLSNSDGNLTIKFNKADRYAFERAMQVIVGIYAMISQAPNSATMKISHNIVGTLENTSINIDSESDNITSVSTTEHTYHLTDFEYSQQAGESAQFSYEFGDADAGVQTDYAEFSGTINIQFLHHDYE